MASIVSKCCWAAVERRNRIDQMGVGGQEWVCVQCGEAHGTITRIVPPHEESKSEETIVTAHDMAEYFRTKFSAESKFRVYSTNAKGIVVTPTPETKLLSSAPAETVHVITAADRDFLKAMKISV